MLNNLERSRQKIRVLLVIELIRLSLYMLIIFHLLKKWISFFVDRRKLESVLFDNYGLYACYLYCALALCCLDWRILSWAVIIYPPNLHMFSLYKEYHSSEPKTWDIIIVIIYYDRTCKLVLKSQRFQS